MCFESDIDDETFFLGTKWNDMSFGEHPMYDFCGSDWKELKKWADSVFFVREGNSAYQFA